MLFFLVYNFDHWYDQVFVVKTTTFPQLERFFWVLSHLQKPYLVTWKQITQPKNSSAQKKTPAACYIVPCGFPKKTLLTFFYFKKIIYNQKKPKGIITQRVGNPGWPPPHLRSYKDPRQHPCRRPGDVSICITSKREPSCGHVTTEKKNGSKTCEGLGISLETFFAKNLSHKVLVKIFGSKLWVESLDRFDAQHEAY